ncbi:MAG: hypothetical protein V7700_14945, partial [Halioglobus sp.]
MPQWQLSMGNHPGPTELFLNPPLGGFFYALGSACGPERSQAETRLTVYLLAFSLGLTVPGARRAALDRVPLVFALAEVLVFTAVLVFALAEVLLFAAALVFALVGVLVFTAVLVFALAEVLLF